jgi:serine/threonine protein kinase
MSLDGAPLNLADIISLEGDLDVRVSPQSPWVTRHCKLTGDSFSVYVDSGSDFPVVSIPITPEISVETDGTPNSLFFELRESGTFRLGCFGGNPAGSHRWIEVIRALTVPQPFLTLADFEVKAVLATLPLGEVLLLERTETREPFAVKVIHKRRLLEARQRRRAIAERNILMLVQHPFIVTLRFAFQTPQLFLIGLEFVPGRRLSDLLIECGAVPLDAARLFVIEVALALHHMHELGIVFGDLRTASVLFDAGGHVKLAGLGHAREIGTYADYMAPEVLLGAPPGFEVDWWALGILFCEMLTGVLPFEATDAAELRRKISIEKPTIPSMVPREAESAIQGLLEKNPDRRLGFCGLLEQPIFAGFDLTFITEKRFDPGWPPAKVPRHIAELVVQMQDSQGASLPEDLFVSGFSFVSPFVDVHEQPVFLDIQLIAEYEELQKDQDIA